MHKLKYSEDNNLLSVAIVAGIFFICYLPVTYL